MCIALLEVGQFLENNLSPLVILRMQKAMIAKVISELKFITTCISLMIFQIPAPGCLTTHTEAQKTPLKVLIAFVTFLPEETVSSVKCTNSLTIM